MARLKDLYKEEVLPTLMEQFNHKNPMEAAQVEKVIVNMGIGDAIQNPKLLEAAADDLARITGQRAIITYARKSISSFKLREGMAIGCKVTLRGERMYHFLDRLFSAALPRVRDFRGLSANAFDGHGNYTLGLREQLMFPEIEYDKVEKVRGMDITIVTTAQSDEAAKVLLKGLGMPLQEG